MGLATAAIVGGAIGIGSGVLGAAQGAQGRNAASTAAKDRMALYGGVELPDIKDQELEFLLPQLVGEYGPEVLQSLNLDPSAMEEISIDPELKLKQLEALTGISEVAEGGLTEADKAASRDIQREVNQNNQARQEAILMNMAQRGVLGSGMELAARMNANQQATDQQAAASDQLIQQAQNRALQAMIQQGNMAGNVRNQDFSQQSQIAQARDAINQFNTQNRQNIANQNVGNRNQAQQMNLQARQAIANAGTDLKNQQQMYNKNLLQQRYNNQMDLANAQSGIIAQRGQQEQQATRDIAAGIGTAGQGLANIFMGGTK